MPEAWRKGASGWNGEAKLAKAGMVWLEAAGPRGDEIVYHRGDLALDGQPRPFEAGPSIDVRACAYRMRRASDAGQVVLLQRRHGEHDYEYIARRR